MGFEPIPGLDRVQIFHRHLHRDHRGLRLLGDGVAQRAVGQRGQQAAMGDGVHVGVRLPYAQRQDAIGVALVERAELRQVLHEGAAGAPWRETGRNGVCHAQAWFFHAEYLKYRKEDRGRHRYPQTCDRGADDPQVRVRFTP